MAQTTVWECHLTVLTALTVARGRQLLEFSTLKEDTVPLGELGKLSQLGNKLVSCPPRVFPLSKTDQSRLCDIYELKTYIS